MHKKTNAECPIGRQVPDLLRTRFDQAEVALLTDFGRTTIAQLAEGLIDRDERQVAE